MFHFVANLKPYTYKPGRGGRRFNSYLLSVDYYREFKELARLVTRQKRILVADNGNVDRIMKLAKRFEAPARTLTAERQMEEHHLGHYARPGELSDALRNKFHSLAEQVSAAAASEIDDAAIRDTLASQTQMTPTYLIGMEDLTLPVLTSLNLEPSYIGKPTMWYRGYSQRAIELAHRTRIGEFGECRSLVFAGLHGLDFDTARQAGALAGAAGLDGVACGLIAALKDNDSIDYRIQDGQIVPLGRKMTRPYIRVMETIAGVSLGFTEVAGRRPRLHALGPGTPILIPLIALMGDASSYTATDSTAPIKDAWKSNTISLYVKDPALVKLKAHKIAQYWIAEGRPWDCGCPFCKKFNRQHPPDLAKARDWWQAEGRRDLKESDTFASSPLTQWLPLLTDSRVSGTSDAALARIGHNHWIIQHIEAQARAHASDLQKLRDWAAAQVEAYVAYPFGDPSWQAAVKEAWRLADLVAAKTASAEPSGALPGFS